MTTTEHDPEPNLRTGALGIVGLTAVAAGGVAPEYSILVVGSVVAGIAGGATPAAFLIAGIGLLGFGVVMASLSRHVAAAGGLYSFARMALGRDVGYITGWLYLGIAVVVAPATFISAAFLMQNFFAAVAPGVTWLSSNWVWWAIIITPLTLFAAYRGVTVSVRLLLTLTAVGIVSILILDIAVLAQGGANGIVWSALSPFNLHGTSVSNLLLAVGLAVTSLAGSEGAVFMAEEARDPHRTVPKAVMITIAGIVVFYLFTSLAFTSGLGTDGTSQWGLLGAGVVQTLADKYVASGFGYFLLAVVAVAGITAGLAFSNYVARLIFEWGRDRHLPRAFALTHHKFQTPYVALIALGVLSAIGFLAGWLWQGGSATGGLTAFSWMYEVDAVLIALIYPIVAIAAAVIGHRTKAGVLVRYVAPLLVVALIGISIKAQFFPFPASPFNIAVISAIGWILAGIIIRAVTRTRHDRNEEFGEEQKAIRDAGGSGEVRLPA
ncbi:APC family permease [Jatrophihabitans sp. YIM 134969]